MGTYFMKHRDSQLFLIKPAECCVGCPIVRGCAHTPPAPNRDSEVPVEAGHSRPRSQAVCPWAEEQSSYNLGSSCHPGGHCQHILEAN